ncbi:MAG TPA: hypothetical protein VFB59_02935 [Candidatus Saccharimonadales bacterium]|nr:hypothetical protein [Candidatus Saccharimonadales bacterium]
MHKMQLFFVLKPQIVHGYVVRKVAGGAVNPEGDYGLNIFVMFYKVHHLVELFTDASVGTFTKRVLAHHFKVFVLGILTHLRELDFFEGQAFLLLALG